MVFLLQIDQIRINMHIIKETNQINIVKIMQQKKSSERNHGANKFTIFFIVLEKINLFIIIYLPDEFL